MLTCKSGRVLTCKSGVPLVTVRLGPPLTTFNVNLCFHCQFVFSYPAAGSRFWQSGTFEVTKSDVEQTDLTASPGGHKSALQVTVPSELEGSAYLQVIVKNLAGRSL